jgi:uncharacterized protein YecE (DUF72 family)
MQRNDNKLVNEMAAARKKTNTKKPAPTAKTKAKAEPKKAGAKTPIALPVPRAGQSNIHVGIGGWTYAPWRGLFYPPGLSHARELAYASRALTSIEINGTYYSTFGPSTWAKWRDETPDGFVFTVKASRYCTNRRNLVESPESIARFINQGISALGDKLGAVNWQFMATKKFNPEEFAAFLALLPKETGGVRLRHALEVRSPTFKDPRFYDLARKHNAAIVFADDDDFPKIDEPTADFTYARLMGTEEAIETGYSAKALDQWAKRARDWAKRGDAFIYMISGAKVRAPAAAMALIERVK